MNNENEKKKHILEQKLRDIEKRFGKGSVKVV